MVNNKIYVGVHKTTDMSDGYMGSGKVILRAIKKHGTNNFKKEILEHFDNGVDMFKREKEVVTDEFLMREDVYNLRRGGSGGFDHINKIGKNKKVGRNNVFYKNTTLSKNGNDKLKELRLNPEYNKKYIEVRTKEINNRYKNGMASSFSKLNNDPSFQEKRKQALINIFHQQGNKNSQFGTMWITKDDVNKKIKKTEFEDFVVLGWVKGRNINK